MTAFFFRLRSSIASNRSSGRSAFCRVNTLPKGMFHSPRPGTVPETLYGAPVRDSSQEACSLDLSFRGGDECKGTYETLHQRSYSIKRSPPSTRLPTRTCTVDIFPAREA